MGAVLSFFKQLGTEVGTAIGTGQVRNLSVFQHLMQLLIMMVLIVGLSFYVYYVIKDCAKEPRTSQPAVALAIQNRTVKYVGSGKDVFWEGAKGWNGLLSQLQGRQNYLINLCPLTMHLAGYMGPFDNGIFQPALFLQKALRAGCRSFVLPISTYKDDNKRPPIWPYSGKPAIVCRNTTGNIVSMNGISVFDFTKALSQYYTANGAQAKEPLLLFLHQVDPYVPDPVKEERQYAMFMHQIALDLEPIRNRCLKTIGQLGSVVGATKENDLLTNVELNQFLDKIIIFTNFNIKICVKDAYAGLTPSLYEYANFNYLPVVESKVTQGITVGSRMLRMTDISGSKVNWTDQSRAVWHSTLLDDPSIVPSPAETFNAMLTGIQCVPMSYFSNVEYTKPIWETWDGYAWKLKEPATRFTKPDSIVPAKPGEQMNARASPELQPGQVKIGE